MPKPYQRLKAKRTTFSAEPEIIEKISADAKARGRKLSNYIADVLRDHVAAAAVQPDGLAPTILEDLCRAVAGARLKELREHLAAAGAVDQPALVADLISALIGWARRNPAAAFRAAPVIIDSREAGSLAHFNKTGMPTVDAAVAEEVRHLSDSLESTPMPGHHADSLLGRIQRSRTKSRDGPNSPPPAKSANGDG